MREWAASKIKRHKTAKGEMKTGRLEKNGEEKVIQGWMHG